MECHLAATATFLRHQDGKQEISFCLTHLRVTDLFTRDPAFPDIFSFRSGQAQTPLSVGGGVAPGL
ncbi:unnamed protein product, partial [Discosporangium mesarthrocarpum]